MVTGVPAAKTLRFTAFAGIMYSHAPHNDVSVNDGPHKRRWSHKTYHIILYYIIIPLCYNCLQYSVQ